MLCAQCHPVNIKVISIEENIILYQYHFLIPKQLRQAGFVDAWDLDEKQ